MYGGFLALFTAATVVVIFGGRTMLVYLLDFADAHGSATIALATILGPMLAAGIAAYAALVVLPTQRKMQQDIDWHRDKRKQFSAFIGTLNEVLSCHISQLTNESREIVALNNSYGIIEIISNSESTRKAAKDIIKEINRTVINAKAQRAVGPLAYDQILEANRTLEDYLYRLKGHDPTQARLNNYHDDLIIKMRAELETSEPPT